MVGYAKEEILMVHALSKMTPLVEQKCSEVFVLSLEGFLYETCNAINREFLQ